MSAIVAVDGLMAMKRREADMPKALSPTREHAHAIWDAAVAAADPFELVRAALSGRELIVGSESHRNTADTAVAPGETRCATAVSAVFSPLQVQILSRAIERAARIIVIGGGKAGATMAAGAEAALADRLDRTVGVVNVPEGALRPLRAIRLNVGRPASVNQPTAAGVAGVRDMLELIKTAGPGDLGLCLLSGGGSALLPAPVEGVSLKDKQDVTTLLHSCGATIDEMNCVRKHLSAVKGGRLAQAFAERGCPLFSLIISDVIGDALDVIASGPTAADPTTFADALAVLERRALTAKTPQAVFDHLRRGAAGAFSETPKTLPATVHNLILANNAMALAAAARRAGELGYPVLNLGAFIEGETLHVAAVMAGIVRSIRADGQPVQSPICLLSGGETTVTLTEDHGLGGRNQEFVLATMLKLGKDGMRNAILLSGGTDGEDGPTDAAGAIADADTLVRAASQQLDPAAFLKRHDAYSFFEKVGGLLKTGLTQTNVMDVRVLLIGA
jgi:hydroxypyruvate reductase/glycerate 2-kinase